MTLPGGEGRNPDLKPYTVAFVSLGCAKNLVNAEQMMALCQQEGFAVTSDPEGADVAVLNTCGFIEAAKSEAIDHIIELGQLKQQGKLKKLLVAGCLSQRYPGEIRQELPEVDGMLGTGSYTDVVQAVRELMAGERAEHFGDVQQADDDGERLVTTPSYTAYLKIAEGCSNGCAFCVIPRLRGRYRSRSMQELLREARGLAERGVQELIVIAQDITRYGWDRKDGASLAGLLAELCKLPFHWIRLHYLYPEAVTDELIQLIARERKIVHYLDIPIQHANDGILKAMRRESTKAEIAALFAKLRRAMPDVVLRTSLICGLPGEGEAEFEELCQFLREQKIRRGCSSSPRRRAPWPPSWTTRWTRRRQPAGWSEWWNCKAGSWTHTMSSGWEAAWRCSVKGWIPSRDAMWGAPTPTQWKWTARCCSLRTTRWRPGSSCGCESPAHPTGT